MIYSYHMIKTVLFFQAATLESKSWRDKISGIYRYSAKARWQVQMVHSGATAEEIRYMLEAWKPIGCIVDRSLSSARNPQKLFRDIPCVFMEQNTQTVRLGSTIVNGDTKATIAYAAAELLQTGISSFSFVPYGLPTYWSPHRERLFRTAIRKAKRDFIPWGETPFHPSLSSAEQDRRLAERLSALPRPLGLLCANDQIAQRVLRTANAHGIAMPKDLAVVGIDNDESICENTNPTLTSVLPDFEGGGYLAAQLLDKLIRNPKVKPVRASYGSLEIFRRQSTRRNASADEFICRVLNLIGQHAFRPDFHTNDLLHELNCSRTYLETRFRKATGRSVREEIQNLRMEKALSLLKNPRQAITPIPALCGYASETTFKRLFKARTGLTMREWRKRLTR